MTGSLTPACAEYLNGIGCDCAACQLWRWAGKSWLLNGIRLRNLFFDPAITHAVNGIDTIKGFIYNLEFFADAFNV